LPEKPGLAALVVFAYVFYQLWLILFPEKLDIDLELF
jgi:hypothetical protein